MCGIFGIMQHRTDSVPDQNRLELSAHMLRHRGPDAYGVYANKGVGMVNTRLSLLDLSARSNQPFWDTEKRYCLVYNGEIYNYQELRSELEGEGISFRSTGDTEVLLECLIAHGVQATLLKLEGMFTFALYDTHKGKLTLARDRFGIKPLYIYDQDDAFIFSSEIRAMRPWIRFEPDLLSIASYLNGFLLPTKGYSFYRNIMIMAPGSVISIKRGDRAEYDRFFSIHEFWEKEEVERIRQLSQQQIVDELEETLLDSVKSQMVSDAPLGGLCSGGIDSALITAMARKFNSGYRIFHANVVGPNSEYEAASTLARSLRLELQSVRVVDQDFIDTMPEVTEHFEHPFLYHPNSVPVLQVAKLVRNNGVKAVLTGEGADECFIGYPWLIFNVRAFVRQLISGSGRPGLIGPLVRGLFNRFEHELESEEIRNYVSRIMGKKVPHRDLETLYQLCYHLRTILQQKDSLGMAASIEARYPFLDSRVVRLAVNMPYSLKVRFSPKVLEKKHYFLRDKWILRKVAERYLPRELFRRPKFGFWTCAHLRMHIQPGFFSQSSVSELLGLTRREIQYLFGRAPQDLKLRLLFLEVWAHMCLYGAPRAKILSRLRDRIRIGEKWL